MRQALHQVRNSFDENGNPTGGAVSAVGIKIKWQDGPLGNPPDMAKHNGAFVEGVIEAAKQRLMFFQGTKFAHDSNAQAIQHLEAALDALDLRTAERKERGVEGKHEV